MLKCPHCEAKRNIKQNLDDHIRLMHPKQKPQRSYETDDEIPEGGHDETLSSNGNDSAAEFGDL